jgi:hypothetical protein
MPQHRVLVAEDDEAIRTLLAAVFQRHGFVGSIRMSNRRMTRLTNAFSKKVENHCHQLAINFAHHNFARIHRTLRCTPAMAAGITTSPWTIADLVKVADEFEITRGWDLAQAS